MTWSTWALSFLRTNDLHLNLVDLFLMARFAGRSRVESVHFAWTYRHQMPSRVFRAEVQAFPA